MAEQEIESIPIISEWGVPDWREASDYPDEEMDLWSWRWEFLRRRDDYRQDWLKYAPETYQKDKVGEVLLPITDLEYCAEMPGAMEKYELALLHHPANPDPQFLCFGSGDIKGVMWEVGRGDGVSNYWEIEHTALEHELVLRFDLTTKPARELLASFTQAWQLSSEDRQLFGMSNTTKSNLPNMFRQHDYAPFPSLKECPASHSNYIRDPQHPGMIHVLWDRRLPYGQQQKDITALLTRLQKDLLDKPQARRVRRSAWPNYLRVLDARAINPKTKKPYATYEEIGYEVFNSQGYNAAKGQAGTAHADALRLMTDFPT